MEPPSTGGVFLREQGFGGVCLPRQSMPVKEAARIAQKIADELQVELVDVELVKDCLLYTS